MSRFAIMLILLVPPAALAADWPQWRGPNGTSTADGQHPEKSDLLWKVAIPGNGNGSPIISGGKVFLQSASADGSKRTLVCLSAKDGTTVWTAEHESQNAPHHVKAGMGANTPAADGTGIYCVWWDGPSISLRAYDPATGTERWSKSLGPNSSQHGAHHSPVVHNGKVFLNLDQDNMAEVLALDAKTGEKVWSAERPAFRASYTTPVLLDRPGRAAELIIGSTAGISSYDPKTGRENWSHAIAWPRNSTKLRMIGNPLFVQGLLIAQTGDGGGSRFAFAIKPVGSEGATTTTTIWELKKGSPYIPGMVAKGEYLFWMTDRGVAVSVEVKTGRIVWEERVFGSEVSASPILMDNGLFTVSEKGRVAIIKAEEEFELVEEWNLGESVIASPAASSGRIYIRGATHLFCYGKK